MERRIRDTKLDSREVREKLPPGKRFWCGLSPGLHLGYRKGPRGGKWLLRRYIFNNAYRVETLGVADDDADPDGVTVLSFAQAQALAGEKYGERVRALR